VKPKAESKLLDLAVGDPNAAFERFRKVGRGILAVPKQAVGQVSEKRHRASRTQKRA
jgi:hypothetical protein